MIRGEDFYIEWSDDEDNEVKERNGEKAKARNDEEAKEFDNNNDDKKKVFGSKSVLSQKTINNLVKKYNISDIYFWALEDKEYMSKPRPHEIAIFIAHLDTRLRISYRKLFIWFIKNFWVQLAQFVPNS